MTFLLLIAFLACIGTFVAVPLFEFVFGCLLLIPTCRFVLGYTALKVGYDIPNGYPSVLLYAVSFLLVIGFAYKIFGRRTSKVETSEYYPLVFFALIFSVAHFLCLRWPDFVDLGERLRDYGILASSIHSPVRPEEPWMDGIKLNYYVYWYRFGNLLSTVLGLEVWQIYHVMLSLAISFYGAVIFQLVRVVVQGPVGLCAAAGVLIPFGSNVAGILSLKRADKGFGWEPDNGWWGPSRVLQGAIDEFPAWSFVLGDAHPHFLNLAALPFFVLILYRILASQAATKNRVIQAGLFVIGATLFLMASNAWEVPMWLGTVAALIVVGSFLLKLPGIGVNLKEQPIFEMVRGGVATVVLLAAIIGVSRFFDASNPAPSIVVSLVGIGFFALCFPFKRVPVEMIKKVLAKRPPLPWVAFWFVLFVALRLSSRHIVPEGMHIDLVRSPILVTTTSELFMHWGVQLGLLTLGSILLLKLSFGSIIMVALLGISALYDKAALFLYCILAFQVVRLIGDKEKEGSSSWSSVFEYTIIISGLVLIITPEIVFINDSYGAEIERMNTIFKLYTTAWGLLGLGTVSVLYRCFRKFGPALQIPSPAFPSLLGGGIVFVLSVAVFFFYKHTAPMRWGGLESRGAARSEGLATADKWHKGSADTIRALRALPRGRVLEAQGRAYSYSSFVSTLAAQPSYLGWPNHINLLNKKEGDEVSRRQKVTDEIYNQPDCQARKEIAKREKIMYVVVGTLERKSYPGIQDRDFSCFASVISSGDYQLFQIPLS